MISETPYWPPIIMVDASKVALITGAGSGIGFAVASGLAADGFFVVLAGRRLENLQDAASKIGDHAYPLVMDVSDPDDISKTSAQLRIPLHW